MKLGHFLLSSVVAVVAVSIANATINSSVNVHFVPPLVAGYCLFGRWWNPPDVTCATCFCMTGSLSRCFPTPGCNPNQSNQSTTYPPPPTMTTADPTASQKPSTGTTMADEPSKPTTTVAPPSSSASTTPTAATGTTTVTTATTSTAAARRRPH